MKGEPPVSEGGGGHDGGLEIATIIGLVALDETPILIVWYHVVSGVLVGLCR